MAINIYEACPTFENERFRVRLFKHEDLNDLLAVYSDQKSLPFFNSDNCDGDIFYYCSVEKMTKALEFWDFSYKNGWFVRMSIEDKQAHKVIGTVEVCKRVSSDSFNNKTVFRVDLLSAYEKEEILSNLFSLVTPHLNDVVGTQGIITKAPIYAVERIQALKKNGYLLSNERLIGKDGYPYIDYWVHG